MVKCRHANYALIQGIFIINSFLVNLGASSNLLNTKVPVFHLCICKESLSDAQSCHKKIHANLPFHNPFPGGSAGLPLADPPCSNEMMESLT